MTAWRLSYTSAREVRGTSGCNLASEKIGQVEDIVLDKQSDHILFAALGFGGVLGIVEKLYPVPWAALDHNKEQGGDMAPIQPASLTPRKRRTRPRKLPSLVPSIARYCDEPSR